VSVQPGERRKAALWARTSTDDQHVDGQLHELREWAANRDLEVVAEFVTEDSAWSTKRDTNGKGEEFDRKRKALLEGARLGNYQVVLARSVDRLSRRGAEDMLSFTRRLTETECALWCRDDPWVEALVGPFAWFARDILLSVIASLHRLSSEQKSQAIRDGIANRKRKGLAMPGGKAGRKMPKGHGAVSGAAGWDGEKGEARREALRQRNRDRGTARQQAEGGGETG
jgi:DNA invertase Pin-like site-specific DNA recombinase